MRPTIPPVAAPRAPPVQVAYGEVVRVTFLDPQRAVFHPLHDGHRMQIDALIGVGLLEDGYRLVSCALFLKRHEYDVLLSHGSTPF